MSQRKLTGSCLCGAVRFTLEGDIQGFYLCHCSRCRKGSGSAHAANLFVSRPRMVWESGQARVRTFHLPDTRFARSFCEVCGGGVPTVAKDGSIGAVPAGCLDSAPPLTPTAHIFAADRAPWDDALEAVPSVPGMPSR